MPPAFSHQPVRQRAARTRKNCCFRRHLRPGKRWRYSANLCSARERPASETAFCARRSLAFVHYGLSGTAGPIFRDISILNDDPSVSPPEGAGCSYRRSQIAPEAAVGSARTFGGISQVRADQSSDWYRGQPGSPLAANETQAPRIAAESISNSSGTAGPNRSLPSGPSETPKLNGTSRPWQAPRARSPDQQIGQVPNE